MKRTATGGFWMVLLLLALPAQAQDDYDSGMGEVSLNAGFALPLGGLGGKTDTNLSDAINFAVPFGIQIGYRIAGVVFVGGTFTYAPFGTPSSDSVPSCETSGVSCHSSFIKAGLSVQWHPLGSRGSDPYIGLGFGYEWLNISISGNNNDASVQYAGFSWVDIPLGWDFRVSKAVRLGPYADFALGEYRTQTVSSPSGVNVGLPSVSSSISPKALHYWLTFGVRVVFLGF